MKRILLMTIVALSWCVCSLAGSVSKYDAGGVPDIHPTGWLQTLDTYEPPGAYALVQERFRR